MQFSFLSEEILKPNKRYVLAEFPHGAFPIGAIVAGKQRGTRRNCAREGSFVKIDVCALETD